MAAVICAVPAAQLLGPELEDMVTNETMPSIMMMLMRCCMCLGGTGDAVGLFGVSPGKMLLPSAKAFLRKRGLPPRNPDAPPWQPLPPEQAEAVAGLPGLRQC